MKAETAAVIAVFSHLRNTNAFFGGPNTAPNMAEIEGARYSTRISYSWQGQNQEFRYTLSLENFDEKREYLELEIRTDRATIRAELQKEATQQYSISFDDNIGDNSDVVPWFKIDTEARYIRDGYHQNADAGEEGPFSGSIELDGLRTILDGYYNNEKVRYVVRIDQ